MIVWTLRARWGNFGLKRIDVLCAGTWWIPSLIIIVLMVQFRRRLFHFENGYGEPRELLLLDWRPEKADEKFLGDAVRLGRKNSPRYRLNPGSGWSSHAPVRRGPVPYREYFPVLPIIPKRVWFVDWIFLFTWPLYSILEPLPVAHLRRFWHDCLSLPDESCFRYLPGIPLKDCRQSPRRRSALLACAHPLAGEFQPVRKSPICPVGWELWNISFPTLIH